LAAYCIGYLTAGRPASPYFKQRLKTDRCKALIILTEGNEGEEGTFPLRPLFDRKFILHIQLKNQGIPASVAKWLRGK
jgi:hypothetical protein